MPVRRLSINNTEIEVVIIGTVAHILDLDYPMTKTVTNAVDNDYLALLRKKIARERGELTFLMYHTDGMISEYDPIYGFKHVDGDVDSRIYRPFKEVANQRRR